MRSPTRTIFAWPNLHRPLRSGWRRRLAPLWLVLAAFASHAAMPPAIWGSVVPRESEQESDSLEEVWKWTVGAESRGAAHGRRQRVKPSTWAAPKRRTQLSNRRESGEGSSFRPARTESSARNGCGAPLRC